MDANLTVNGGDRRPRLGERKPFDQADEFRCCASDAMVGASVVGEGGVSACPVAGEPALQGALGDARAAGQSGKRDCVLDVQSKDSPPLARVYDRLHRR